MVMAVFLKDIVIGSAPNIVVSIVNVKMATTEFLE